MTSVPVSAADMSWIPPQRFHTFTAWLAALAERYALDMSTVRHASADAGFRRYLRVDTAHAGKADGVGSYIIMDAPPQDEDCAAFVRIAALLQQANIPAASVLEWDKGNGFMLLPDLGTHTLLQSLQEKSFSEVQGISRPQSDDDATMRHDAYLQAIDLLISWQLASKPGVLPVYDAELLQDELALFPEWYIVHHRQYALKDSERLLLQQTFQTLVKHNLQVASVFVHRDYMPRNLMVRPGGSLAVLDFQDAVYGPMTYDIASLLRDAFISWEEEFVLDMAVRYWERARYFGLPAEPDFGTFYRQIEWMGLQRHLKIAGIFARLSLRDGKPKYLKDTPRFMQYIRNTVQRYAELRPLLPLLDNIEGTPVQNACSFGRM